MRRSIVGLILAGCAASPSPAPSGAFEEAKRGDEARKLEFLDGLLGKLVYDKERNPAGYVKAWYYVPAAVHKGPGCRCGACAREALRQEYKKDGREKSFEKEMPAILQALEKPAGALMPFYGERAPLAEKKCQGLLLVGDLFSLRDEEELRSAVDDFLLAYLKDAEDGMVFMDGDNEVELKPYIPAERKIARSSLINLHARSVQIGKIAGRDRRVSEGYRQAVVRDYLDSLKLYSGQYAHEKKIFEDNEDNTLQKEIVDFLKFMRKIIQADLKKAGLEHREIDPKAHEYALEGF